MKIKIQTIKVLIILCLYAFPAFSQNATKTEDCNRILQTAMELFNNAKYGSAIHEFQKLQEMAGSGSVYADEAAYHIPVCYLEMGNQNGRGSLEAFIEQHPGWQGSSVHGSGWEMPILTGNSTNRHWFLIKK